MASRTISASSPVVATGRAATMALAMRRAKRSSPNVLEDAGQLGFVGAVDDVVGGADLSLVHAHVEGRVVPVAEAALGSVELGGADPEVEEHAAHRCCPKLLHGVFQGVEPNVLESGAVAEGLKPLGGGGEGVGVLIEPQHLEVRVVLEDGAGVPRATDGGVDHPTGRHRGEELDDAFEEDRLVPEPVAPA